MPTDLLDDNMKMRNIIVSRLKLAIRFWSNVNLYHGITDEDCWEWIGGQDGRGYGCMSINNKGKKAHHISFYLCYNRWPTGIVRHKCDSPSCINPTHLVEGTYQDNSNDAIERNRIPKGFNHPKSVLTNSIVKQIDILLSQKVSHKEIAATIGVSRATISSYKRGDTYGI